MNSKVTYRQQFTRCGKQRCRKCREGAGHGPYWYAYWSEKGRTISKYIGVRLPDDIAAQQRAERENTQQTQAQTALSPNLRIYLLGQFRIERKLNGEWQNIDSRPWHRRRARALLGCLLSSSGRRVSREQAMEMLWPDQDIDVAANRLNGAVHELRQILEPDIARPANSRLLRLDRDILELADNSQIWVDTEAFEQLLKDAKASDDPEVSMRLLEEAAALYRGNYLLEELYAEWAAPRRDALQRSWVGLQLNLAQLRSEHADYSGAIETLDRLRTAEPTNETALQRLMLLLTHLDRRGEALKVYHQHKSMLKRDYEGEPLPETIALYEELRRGHIPGEFTPPRPTKVHQKTPPAPTEATQPIFSFSRPIFHIGRHNQSPLIGREQEMTLMRRVLRNVEAEKIRSAEEARGHTSALPPVTSSLRARRTHFLLLKGESGIGKTRLAEELSIEAYRRGWAVAWSRSYEQEGTIPYHLWTDLLRTLLQNTSPFKDMLITLAGTKTAPTSPTSLSPPLLPFKTDRLSAILPELGNAASPSSTAPVLHEQERLHLWEEMLGLLNTLSKFSPLLLILDDLHWADDSSIELLTYLTHHLQKQHIMLIGTCRDGELVPKHKLRGLITDLRREQAITTIEVQPLTQSQIGALVSHLSGAAIENIQQQAAGNPFFAEELARVESGTSFHDEVIPIQPEQHSTSSGLSRSLLPEAIAAVLERRLSRLSHNCQTLLGRAAVLGGSFELTHLLPMATEFDEDSILDLLEEALDAGLITEAGNGAHISYHFWHPLIISHLYARVSAARRAQLHRRAAEAIKTTYSPQQQEKAAAIVYHLCRGGGELHDIANYAELAGRQAYAIAAYSEAQRHYLQEVQALLGDDVSRKALYLPEAIDIPTQLRGITPGALIHAPVPDPLHLSHRLELIAECTSVQGNFADARYLYECVLELRSSQPFQQRVRLHNDPEEARQHEAQIQALLWREICKTWTLSGNYTRAYECNRRGQQIMARAGVTQGPAWACVQVQYGDMLRLEGNYQEARLHLQDALEMLDPQLAPGKEQGAFPSRRKIQTRTQRAFSADPVEVGYGHERLGIVEASSGQAKAALEHMHTALRIFQQNELVSEEARIHGNLGAVYILLGEYHAARTHLRQALTLAERTGDTPNTSFIMQNLGDVANRSGNLLEAEDWLSQSWQLGERINYRERLSVSRVDLAAVQQNLGKTKEARESLLYAIRVARPIGNPRIMRYALVQLGDQRIYEALATCHCMPNEMLPHAPQTPHSQRLIRRAQSTLQRALALKSLESEIIVEGKYLLATCYYLLGDLTAAIEKAQETLRDAQQQGTVRSYGRTYRLLGHIAVVRGDYEEAFAHYEHALQTFQERGLRLDYARTLQHYGVAHQQLYISSTSESNVLSIDGPKQIDEVYQQGLVYLREARAIFADCHAAIDLARVEEALAQAGTLTTPGS